MNCEWESLTEAINKSLIKKIKETTTQSLNYVSFFPFGPYLFKLTINSLTLLAFVF
jgi:hypothetical protein